jgi:hypothetical protein
MKQLTILCSDSIATPVTLALEKHIEQDGYVRISNGYGVKCKVPVEGVYSGRCIPWQAEVFITALPDETVEKIVSELKQYAAQCETSPCLRMIITPVDEIY